MSKRIRVTPEELGQASSKFSELAGTYTDIYTQLLQQASTMGQAWEGEDNMAFVNQITGFSEDLKAMANHLEQASQALKTQQQNYEQRQQANISSVQKLTN